MSNDNLARQRDQFYTQETVAKECLEQLFLTIDVKNYLFLEPSAGTGSFINLLKTYECSYLAIDIEPKNENIILKDFLLMSEQDLINELPEYKNKPLISIGNPPFGKNSSLAIRFFNHAAKYSKYIAMIFPATFEKDSVIKRLDKKMHLISSTKLKNDLFHFNEKLVSVPTVFQIWEKKEISREQKENKFKSEYFEFVTKEKANFAIQRVGVAAGKVKKEIKDLPKTSHYFIKANDDLYKLFSEINWEVVKYRTAGNPSISKKELIELFEIKMKKSLNNESNIET